KAQQQMGESLWPLLPSRASNVLDLGCGPGHWSRRLAARFGSDCRVVGLDLAPGMLEVACRETSAHVDWLRADAAALPLADGQLDLVFSNLVIQWCPDLDGVMTEIHRVLRNGGRAVINTLGPGTLSEIAQAWSSPQALLDFRSRDRYLACARLACFSDIHCHEATERFFYPDLAAVMDSVKGIGAQTPRPAARLARSDLARAHLVRAQRCCAALRARARLTVSYHPLPITREKESESCRVILSAVLIPMPARPS